jgi:SAM-dependent methyltransferase
MSDQYVFLSNDDARELARLRMLQTVHDPMTREMLARAGLRSGMTCAEIGAGAGSIAAHMTGVVGPAGRVAALDLDLRFLARPGPAGFEPRQGDILDEGALEPAAYDLIHTRFLLVHLADPALAIGNIQRALKPGGAFLAEEPDFGAAGSEAASEDLRSAIDAVNQAVMAMYRNSGRDPRLGLRLSTLLRAEGMEIVDAATAAPVSPGGDTMSLMMAASIEHLGPRLAATGAATARQVDAYCAAARAPGVWNAYYSTISIIARRAGG